MVHEIYYLKVEFFTFELGKKKLRVNPSVLIVENPRSPAFLNRVANNHNVVFSCWGWGSMELVGLGAVLFPVVGQCTGCGELGMPQLSQVLGCFDSESKHRMLQL